MGFLVLCLTYRPLSPFSRHLYLLAPWADSGTILYYYELSPTFLETHSRKKETNFSLTTYALLVCALLPHSLVSLEVTSVLTSPSTAHTGSLVHQSGVPVWSIKIFLSRERLWLATYRVEVIGPLPDTWVNDDNDLPWSELSTLEPFFVADQDLILEGRILQKPWTTTLQGPIFVAHIKVYTVSGTGILHIRLPL